MKDGASGLLKQRLAKGWNLLPVLASHPSRIPWLFEGVTAGRLAALDLPWLQTTNIRTVLDIGANTGQFASTIHHLLPQAAIYAFEPLPECYEAMMQRLGSVPNFHGYRLAIGREDSLVDFHRNDFVQSSSVLPMADLHRQAFAWSAHSTTVQVPMARLDRVLVNSTMAARILVKIDVQGYEDRVLMGGERTIRGADVVMVETSLEMLYEGQASFERVYEIMRGYGFRYAGNMDQLSNPEDGRVLQVDALFLRSD